MHNLVERRKYGLLELFIFCVRDPDVHSSGESTSLYRVAEKLEENVSENREMVAFLIRKGADVLWQHQTTGFTPSAHIIQCNGNSN